ncbi:hypothetical protein [Sphingomonas sp. HMP9]|nr:hypothetical protein [Sphingomonas sp. HMP9]
MTAQASVSIHCRTLTDAFYGAYFRYPTPNVYVGSPRGGEIALSTQF